jgi:hypothetical protein
MPKLDRPDRARPGYPLRRPGLRAAAVAAAGTLTLGIAPSLASASARPDRPAIDMPPAAAAYAYANRPTTHSYTPEAAYSFNSSGGGIGIVRTGLGKYTVTFSGLGGEALGGTVDVTAEGNQPAQCEVTSWDRDSTGFSLQVGVDCFAVAGARMDAPYMVAFTSGGSTSGTTDYVWASRPTTLSYAPAPAYSFNSSGTINKITRLGVGQYQVNMPGPAVSGGTVKVTAYGTAADSCQVAGWVGLSTGQVVDVHCFDATGAAANDKFTVTYTNADDLLGDGGDSGYLWGDDPTNPHYMPDLVYQWDTVGSQATVTRSVTGQYENQFPKASMGNTGDEQATAYGAVDAHCIVDGPAGKVGFTQTADVFCYDTSGNPMDVYYTVQWMVN